MEGPRSARIQEFNEVIELINHVFRITENHKPTMQYEFPLLLNEGNVDNMIIIKEDNKAVSGVNFLQEDIVIQGAKIKAASIGGVCTHEDYRGKRYAGKILDKVESKMLEDGVDVVLISGERDLYRRRKCSLVYSHYKYEILPKEEELDIEIKEYDEKYLNKIIGMYNLNSTRYLRTYEEFKILLEAATFPWGDFTYKKYLLFRESEVIGYLILRIIDGEERHGQIIECFCNPIELSKVASNVAKELSLKYILHWVHVKDYNNKIYNIESVKIDNLHGTLKIINYEKLMNNLKHYFIQYMEEDKINEYVFKEKDGKYIIEFRNEKIVVEDIELLNRLIFEGYKDEINNLEECPNIQEFIDRMLPIPFIWSANLNYQ